MKEVYPNSASNMSHAETAQPSYSANKTYRWLTLLAVLFNVVVSSITDRIGIGGESMAEVTRHYDSLFVPAGYAFSIWGVIYLSFILYAVIQLLPKQMNKPIYDRLNGPVAAVNLLGLAWQLVYRYQLITISLIIILIMLVTGAILFVRAQQGVWTQRHNRWLMVPPSLFLGWICVAAIANVSIWLVAMGWDGGSIGEATWTIILLSVSLLLSLFISIRYKNFIYPAVIAWSAYAIWIALQNRTMDVAQAALYVAGAAIILTLVAALRSFRKPSYS